MATGRQSAVNKEINWVTDEDGNLLGYMPNPKTLVSLAPTSALLISLAQNLDAIISGAITRDSNGAALSSAVVWPDGATGSYTATSVSSSFPGAVDAYTVTHVLGGLTTTYTQPSVTRNSSGAVTNKPDIVVS